MLGNFLITQQKVQQYNLHSLYNRTILLILIAVEYLSPRIIFLITDAIRITKLAISQYIDKLPRQKYKINRTNTSFSTKKRPFFLGWLLQGRIRGLGTSMTSAW